MEEKLIEAVRCFPCLWQVAAKAYRDQRAKENAWKEVANKVKLHGKYGLHKSLSDSWKQRFVVTDGSFRGGLYEEVEDVEGQVCERDEENEEKEEWGSWSQLCILLALI